MADRKLAGKSLQKSSAGEISAFLNKTRALQARPAGRLLFALDATASRQATWDRACHLQARMFEASRDIAGLSIQLCYYRGLDEFRALPWSDNSPHLRQQMLSVSCLGGYTQIGKVLRHALTEHRKAPVKALVFVGDAVEEHSGKLYQLAGQLGIQRLPAFLFQEGHDAAAGQLFAEIARLSGGVHCRFDENSEGQLRELLTAVAVYASGGRAAVRQLKQQSPLIQQMIAHLPGD